VCETIHRSKGLEFDVVILIAMSEEVSDSLLYVGASRAVSLLTVISPPSVAVRLGIA
jgi:ATP-dependent exoDNAse (exonuclease V) alpha subunit